MFELSPFPRESLATRVQTLATQGIFIGTSSWKYQGWLNLLYQEGRYQYHGNFSSKRFLESCLAEYAEIFRTVCVDASFYRFPHANMLDSMMKQVPIDFLFGFKVTGTITLKHFPNLPQHGIRAGQSNPHFLDPERFMKEFLAPLEPYRHKTGLLIFEFTQFRDRDYSRGRDFLEDLDRFLGKLPSDWNYGVEIRNANWLQSEYFKTLGRYRVAHIFNHWTRMPPVGEQLTREGSITTDFLAARFLLTPGRSYAEAVNAFSPYSEIKAPDLSGREAGRELIERAKVGMKRKSFLFVNNRFEGCSPRSILAMIELKREPIRLCE